jgi:putative transposase
MFSRRVVGWAMADHLGHELALPALDMAIVRQRPTPGLIHHSIRGVQFPVHEYRKRFQQHGEARANIFQFLEGWYNRRRMH